MKCLLQGLAGLLLVRYSIEYLRCKVLYDYIVYIHEKMCESVLVGKSVTY